MGTAIPLCARNETSKSIKKQTISRGNSSTFCVLFRKDTFIGVGAVVTRDAPEKAIVIGAPIQIQGYERREELNRYMHRTALVIP